MSLAKPVLFLCVLNFTLQPNPRELPFNHRPAKPKEFDEDTSFSRVQKLISDILCYIYY